MKLFSYLICITFFIGFAQAQSADLPAVLIPDQAVISQPADGDQKIVKLLPRGYFGSISSSYADKDSPIGVRGDGAFFSFSSLHHSYNKIPQLLLEKEYFSVGFYGANYGLMRDIGTVQLSELNEVSMPVTPFLTYSPPRIEKEAREEVKNLRSYRGPNGFTDRIPVRLGHTYLLRAISYNEADILVAFTVNSIQSDGSVNLVWKKIADFNTPKLLTRTDDELMADIRRILSDERFKLVEFSVLDNVVTLTGSVSRSHLADLMKTVNEAEPIKVESMLTID